MQVVDEPLRGKVVYGMKLEPMLQRWLNHQSQKMMKTSLVDGPLQNEWQNLEVSDLAWLLLLEHHPPARPPNPKEINLKMIQTHLGCLKIKMQNQIKRTMAIKFRKKTSGPEDPLLPLEWQQWVVVDLECMEQEPYL
jgi:hypothetical protein